MKLRELFEASFTPKHFPKEGNEGFPGVGERLKSNYIGGEQNSTEGFALSKQTILVKPDGDRVTLEQGQKVFITEPGVLKRGSDIPAGKKGLTYTKVSLRSKKSSDFLGYIPLGSLEKPAGKTQNRVGAGSDSQDEIVDHIKDLVGEENFELVSVAPKGSTKPDMIAKLHGKSIQFEIKGADSASAPITVFDISTKRGARNEILDTIAREFSSGEFSNFEELMNFYREKDPSVGYVGDEGVSSSGKLPKELKITDSGMLEKIRDIVLKHFRKGTKGNTGDDYFVVHVRGSVPKIYDLGSDSDKMLDVPDFPSLKSCTFATAGGASSGSIRIGFKIKI